MSMINTDIAVNLCRYINEVVENVAKCTNSKAD